MEVTIIIVNYNSTALTAACLESIFQHSREVSFEVIVIDNASPQCDLKSLEPQFPEVKFHYHTLNGGFSKANNQGIRMARGKYLFLLNPDTLLTSNALKTFHDYMEAPAHQQVASCGGTLLNGNGELQVAYGNFPGIAESIALLGPGLFYKKYYQHELSAGVKVYQEQPHDVDYISGAALFLRREAVVEVGGFDEDFFLYFEETRLAYVLRQKGYRARILPEVKIVHLEGGSQSAVQKKQKQKLFARSRKLFLEKCYGKAYALFGHALYQLQQAIYHAIKKGT